MTNQLAEDAHAEPPAGGSDRGFGILFATLFAAVGLWPLLDGEAPYWWWLAAAAALLSVALAKAHWLAPGNRLWSGFGRLLHRLVSPLVMALIYFAVITPTGLIMRALGKDPLLLGRDPQAKSYWIQRRPPGPAPETMANQF